MIELRLLQYFVAVAEELHFGRAASRLQIRQPPLSQAIQKLERDLGIQLLLRSRRHVELTEAGELLLQAARRTLAQNAQFNVTAEQIRSGRIGTLHVGYTASMPFLPAFMKVLRRVRAECPDVTFELTSVATRSALPALNNGSLDIAVVRSLVPIPASLESMAIGQDRLMLILPKWHPLADETRIALRELADETFVQHTRQRHTEFHEFLQKAWLRECSNSRRVQEADDTPTVMAMVAAGLGISILPSTLKAITIADLVWRDIAAKEDELVSTIIVVYPRNAKPSPIRERFVELLRSETTQPKPAA